MPTGEELKAKVTGLETALSGEQDAAKKAEIQTQLNEAQAAVQEAEELLKGKDKEVVPLYKFKKLNDQLKEKEAKLKKIEDEKVKEQEADMKKKGELEGLLSKKEERITSLTAEIESIKDQMKSAMIKSIIMQEANKFNPYDERDVLNNINMSKIEVGEDAAGAITVNGAEAEIIKLKKDKPYLFKAKADDKKIDEENERIKATPESIEIEFRKLQDQKVLTPKEQVLFRELGQKLSAIRAAKAK